MTDWSTPRMAPAAVRRRERLTARALDRASPVRRLDYILIAAVLALCLLGAVLVWSATRPYNASLGLDPQAYLKKDILNIVIGLVVGIAATLVDYRTLRAYWPVLYGACCLGLLAVLSPLGSTVNGAHAWISLGGGFEVQPSEFTKITLIIGMAVLLSERRDRDSVTPGPGPRDADVGWALLLAAVPILLILVEPDLGVVLVCLALVFGVIALSGARTRWVLGLLVVAAVGGALVVNLHLLKSYQIQRLTSFTNPNANATSSGYNTQQATIAIGSGGLTGQGLFHGTQTNGHFVPEQQTDFIFTVAGEELGFVGSAGLIALLGVVLWRGMRIASRAGDPFGRLVAVGVVCWFGFQSFQNIGMTLGIMPVTGIPLPFISYGGSAMFANMIAVGLLENVHMRSQE